MGFRVLRLHGHYVSPSKFDIFDICINFSYWFEEIYIMISSNELKISILIPNLAEVFKHFEKDGEFFCFAGQLNQAVTGMFNLYRASQVLFKGEEILENAKSFSAKYLTEKRHANELLDKWIITKDLPGEVSSNFRRTNLKI